MKYVLILHKIYQTISQNPSVFITASTNLDFHIQLLFFKEKLVLFRPSPIMKSVRQIKVVCTYFKYR